MKKLLITALIGASTLGVSSVATAGHVGLTFENRGQCEAKIADARNNRRKASEENAGEFNKGDIPDYVCEENDDGTFTIVDLGDD